MDSKDNNLHSIGDAIKKMVKDYHLKEKLTEVQLNEGWERIMGKMIAKHTTQIFIHEGKLHLHLDSAPLKQELMFARTKIKEVLNKEAGEEVITEVVIH